jgi:hypothetical protein
LKNFYRLPFLKWPPQYHTNSTSLSTHISNFEDIGQCSIFAVLWWPFWKWRLLENFQCRESIHDIIIYPHIKFWRCRLLCPELIPWHWKISTGLYFQNGHHNIAKIQHCPILSQFDMWVDNDVKNLSFCDIVVAILKMATVRKFSMSGINSWHHYLPTYQIVMISDNVEFLRYCGGHFENRDR